MEYHDPDSSHDFSLIYVLLMFFFHLYIQNSIYICKLMESFNAGGHSLVNLLVKMLFWLSVSLKQVARMYLYRRNTVHYALFASCYNASSMKEETSLSIIHMMQYYASPVKCCILYYSFCTVA